MVNIVKQAPWPTCQASAARCICDTASPPRTLTGALAAVIVLFPASTGGGVAEGCSGSGVVVLFAAPLPTEGASGLLTAETGVTYTDHP